MHVLHLGVFTITETPVLNEILQIDGYTSWSSNIICTGVGEYKLNELFVGYNLSPTCFIRNPDLSKNMTIRMENNYVVLRNYMVSTPTDFEVDDEITMILALED